MELTLNVYGKDGKVIKTLTRKDYELLFGTVEDIVEIIDFNKLLEDTSEDQLFDVVNVFVNNAMGEVKRLLHDIFPDASDDDLKRVKVSDVVRVIMSVVMFTFSGLGRRSKGKN